MSPSHHNTEIKELREDIVEIKGRLTLLELAVAKIAAPQPLDLQSSTTIPDVRYDPAVPWVVLPGEHS